jgi:hypothetical protein
MAREFIDHFLGEDIDDAAYSQVLFPPWYKRPTVWLILGLGYRCPMWLYIRGLPYAGDEVATFMQMDALNRMFEEQEG